VGTAIPIDRDAIRRQLGRLRRGLEQRELRGKRAEDERQATIRSAELAQQNAEKMDRATRIAKAFINKHCDRTSNPKVARGLEEHLIDEIVEHGLNSGDYEQRMARLEDDTAEA